MSLKNSPLKIAKFIQSRGLCGPASLKIALSYFKQNFSENRLADLAKASRKKGTEHSGMIAAARAVGAKIVVKQNSTLADLRRLILRKRRPVIVGWYDKSGKEGDHYSVVYHLSPHYIYLMDPATKTGFRKMSIDNFMRHWYDFEGVKNNKIHRWFMDIDF